MEPKIKAVMLDELKKIGLSENEAGTYLALLELGSATAQEISRKSGIKRATTYVQLEALMKLGLVASFEKAPERKNGAPKTFFRGEDPEHLTKIVERAKKLEEERGKALSAILPDLGKLYLSASERPRVRFFEGVGGLRTMQDELIKTKADEVVGFSSGDDVLRIFPQHPSEFSPRRVRAGIRSRLIYTSSRGKILKENDPEMLREAKYIPPEKFPFTCDVTIYGPNVSISALRKKPLGVMIESEEIADAFRAIFNLSWETAK